MDEANALPAGPRVAVFGLFGYGNFGNDASFAALIQSLRQKVPNVNLIAIVHDPEFIARKFALQTVRMIPPAPTDWRARLPGPLRRIAFELHRWRSISRTLRGIEYLVIPGTGILDDYGAAPMATPYRLWLWTLLSRWRAIPAEFVAVGVGRFNTRLAKFFCASAARMARHRSFRDAESRARAHDDLRVDTRADVVVPDIVFSLPRAPQWSEPAASVGTIGVGAQSYHNRRGLPSPGEQNFYPGYIDLLARFCTGLLDRGLRLRLLMGDTGDAAAVEDLRDRLAQARPDARDRVVCNLIGSLEEACVEISQCDAVVATRFHNIVASLMVGRPTVSVGYASKNVQLMLRFGLAELCQTIDEGLDLDLLGAQFASATADPAEVRRRIEAVARELHDESQQHLDTLAGRIKAAALRRGKPASADASADALTRSHG